MATHFTAGADGAGIPVIGSSVQEMDPVSAAVTSFGGVMGVGTIYSRVTTLQNVDSISYDVAWTGNPTGQWYVEVSNTYNPRTGQGRWHELTGFSPTLPAPAGAPGQFGVTIRKCGYRFIRLKYIGAASTGQAEATAYATGD
jgi:hypothetical protein